LTKAREIIFELNASLDMDAGGEIAKNLRSVYSFLWTRLTQVNSKNDVVLLDRLIHILEDLAKAWRRILED
jgi:flagellar protein FliS